MEPDTNRFYRERIMTDETIEIEVVQEVTFRETFKISVPRTETHPPMEPGPEENAEACTKALLYVNAARSVNAVLAWKRDLEPLHYSDAKAEVSDPIPF